MLKSLILNLKLKKKISLSRNISSPNQSVWNSPHSYPRYNFSFLLKYGCFEPSLPFQTTNLVQICTAEGSSASAPSPQSTHNGCTMTQLRCCCGANSPENPFEHYGFSSPSSWAVHTGRHLYLQLPCPFQTGYLLPPKMYIYW